MLPKIRTHTGAKKCNKGTLCAAKRYALAVALSHLEARGGKQQPQTFENREPGAAMGVHEKKPEEFCCAAPRKGERLVKPR